MLVLSRAFVCLIPQAICFIVQVKKCFKKLIYVNWCRAYDICQAVIIAILTATNNRIQKKMPQIKGFNYEIKGISQCAGILVLIP